MTQDSRPKNAYVGLASLRGGGHSANHCLQQSHGEATVPLYLSPSKHPSLHTTLSDAP